ncbi:MAG: hypothetical protein KDE45_24410, partial [Caldilineaceae bacterium]|nr:hypothetical protein [Caldilineaceae bacterium]
MSIDNASRDVGAASVRRSASALSGVTGLGWAWWVTGLLLLAMGAYFVRHEGWPANVVFTMALTGVLISILILATRRVLFATSVVAAAVAVIVIAATIKYSYMGMVLHAYDVAFYLFSRDTLWYLWID